MSVKVEFKDNDENYAADPEIKFLRKSISKPYARGTALSPGWELIFLSSFS